MSLPSDRIAEVVGKLEYEAGTYAFVLNSQGVPIVHPDTRLMGNIDKAAPSLLESADTNLANVTREMVYQKTGIVLTQINDARVYVAYLPLEQAEWSIALVIPSDNLEKELFALNILAAAATGLFATAILAVIVALKLFAQKCIRTRAEAPSPPIDRPHSRFLGVRSHPANYSRRTRYLAQARSSNFRLVRPPTRYCRILLGILPGRFTGAFGNLRRRNRALWRFSCTAASVRNDTSQENLYP